MDMLDYIISLLPIILSVVSELGIVIGIVIKVSAYFKDTNKIISELKESPEYTALKNQMEVVLIENAKLKEQMILLLEAFNKFKVFIDY